MRSVAEKLRLAYAQFLELEFFTRIEGGGDEATRRTLERGRRVRAALVQPALAPLTQGEQVALLFALEEGLFDEVPVEAVTAVRRVLRGELEAHCAPLLAQLDRGQAPDASQRQVLREALAVLVQGVAGGRD
jgi:F0F1-type ATP synthase alpha subunit